MNDLTKKSGDRGSMEESDLRTAFWLEDDIVQRFNKLYSVDYEYRNLRDAFSGSLEALTEAYRQEYGEWPYDDGDGFETRFKLKRGDREHGMYYFFKLSRNSTDSRGLPITYNEDEELEELCVMFSLCLEFTDRSQRTIQGMETLGHLLEKRISDDFSFKDNPWESGRKIYQAMQFCIRDELNDIQKTQKEINKLYKKLQKVERAVEGVTAFQEGELKKIIDHYSKDVLMEFKVWCVYSQAIAEGERSSIKTYKSREAGSDGKKKDKTVQTIHTKITITENLEEEEKRRAFKELYEQALREVEKRAESESRLMGKWEDAVDNVCNELKKLDKDMKEVMKEAFLKELTLWRERACLFVVEMLRNCLLDRTRYWIQSGKSDTFSWNTETGEFLPRFIEEEFQKEWKPESKERYMADVWAKIVGE